MALKLKKHSCIPKQRFTTMTDIDKIWTSLTGGMWKSLMYKIAQFPLFPYPFYLDMIPNDNLSIYIF